MVRVGVGVGVGAEAGRGWGWSWAGLPTQGKDYGEKDSLDRRDNDRPVCFRPIICNQWLWLNMRHRCILLVIIEPWIQVLGSFHGDGCWLFRTGCHQHLVQSAHVETALRIAPSFEEVGRSDERR